MALFGIRYIDTDIRAEHKQHYSVEILDNVYYNQPLVKIINVIKAV